MKKNLAFEKEERELFVHRVRTATFYLAVPLVLSFWGVDLLVAPEKKMQFLAARLMSIPVSLLVYNMYRFKIFRERFYTGPMQILFAYLGVYNAYLITLTGYEHSVYYAGLNLAVGGALSFLPLSPINIVGLTLLCFGPFFANVMWHTGGHPDWAAFVPAVAFCLSTLFVGTVTNLFMYILRKKEFDTRDQLREEIETKNTVITAKTAEGIYLEKLTNQFSPQIIEAVKSGEISVDGMLRREVTCLFIDIESSTNRSIRLDREDYTAILAEFLGSVTDVLTSYDVTVGTFLGDGLLAFANAPKSQPSHRKTATEAALAILKMHHSREKYYLEKWRNNFTIRLGINTGYVFVGFFPSFRRGNYTALGAPVNLASRLCAHAPGNSILVTKSFIKEIGAELSNVKVAQVKTLTDMKGFEGETFELFTIAPEFSKETGANQSCPLCQAALFLQKDLGDSKLYKCSSCNYTDLVGNAESLPKAA